jgi:hypothetical protein
MPNNSLQAQLDEYIRTRLGVENKIPDEYCTIDRSGGADGPWFNGVTVNGDSGSLNVQGQVYSTAGNVTKLEVWVDDHRIKLNPDVDMTQGSGAFDATFANFPAAIESGRYQVHVKAFDDTGKTKEIAFNNVIIRNEVNDKFTLRATAGQTDFIWGTSIGNGTSTSLSLAANPRPAGLTNASVYVSKNGGGFSLVGTATPPGFAWSWGNTIANENATYTFYVTGTAGNTGNLKSITPVLTLNVQQGVTPPPTP